MRLRIRDQLNDQRARARHVLHLRRRVLRGDAPHMETLIWHYRFGKPKDTLEINQPRPLVVEVLADLEAHVRGGGPQ